MLKTISPAVILLLCSLCCRSEGTSPAREATSKSALLDNERVTSRSESPTRNPGEESLEDAEMQEALARALRKDRMVPSDEVQVRVADGVVELTGQVPNLLAVERASLVAASIKGVRAVDNLLTVQGGVVRLDDDIRADSRTRLFWDTLADERLLVVTAEDN